MRGCSIRCFTAQGGRQTDLNVNPRYPFELQSRFLSDIPAMRRAAWRGLLHGARYGVGALSSVLAAAIRFYGRWHRQPPGSAPWPPWVRCKGLWVIVVCQRRCWPGDGGPTTVASKPAGGSGAGLRAIGGLHAGCVALDGGVDHGAERHGRLRRSDLAFPGAQYSWLDGHLFLVAGDCRLGDAVPAPKKAGMDTGMKRLRPTAGMG